MVAAMVTVASREAYFETGLDVLADRGYGGLKLAEVCRRLGVTSGSFYHYFPSWSAYTGELVEQWLPAATRERVAHLRTMTDPRRRIDAIFDIGMALPHGAEAAVRVWSALDPKVRAVQVEVDELRFEILRESALEILHDERQAELFAGWSLYLLVGYEQSTRPPDQPGLAWMVTQLLEALDSGRFSSAPPK
mgnify:CR=1 FL=1